MSAFRTGLAAFFSLILVASLFAIVQFSQVPPATAQVRFIAHLMVDGHIVSISQFRLSGPDVGCEFNHYHAASGGFVVAYDGTIIYDPDPSGCGYATESEADTYATQVITSQGYGITFSRNVYINDDLQSGFYIGTFEVNVEALKSATDLDSGFLNVVTGDDWVVKNLPVLEDFPYDVIATDFELADEEQEELTATVQYSELAYITIDEAKYTGTTSISVTYSMDIKEIELCAIPYNATSVTRPPTLDDVLFGDPSKTNATIQYEHRNIEAAQNQCMPTSMANSLQFLEDTKGLNVPHDHKPGVKGDDSLVGQLDTYTNRTVTDRQNGKGTWGLEGKLKYLAANGLENRVKNSHWGTGIPSGASDFTVNANGKTVTSKGMGEKIKFEDIFDALNRGLDCELVYSWNGGAHAVVLVGAGTTNGVPWIMHASDLNQGSDSAGTRQFTFDYLTDTDKNGEYELSGTNERITQVICEEVVAAPPAPPGQPQTVPVAAGEQEFAVDTLLTTGIITGITPDPEASSIILEVESGATADGELTITLPRELIDARDGDSDGEFIVMVNGEQVPYEETSASETERELKVSVPANTQSVEIVGTYVVPEFPVAALILAALIATVIGVTARGRFSRFTGL
ncbi:hypothetical protein [Nitrososphaera sp.]|uniref:hypothetical protein n=1 Tax=Nitrososphaera sp. TaxID=1971748 RepID=UPI00184C0CFC|nr:hypothetical protein [Nitrososphaera sp.]NWG36983.1 hypothetical protein [Nitrososphaera sp.]